MKLFHPHSYEKLGFDVVLEALRARVMSAEACEQCAEIRPVSDAAQIQVALSRVHEFKGLIESGDNFPVEAFAAVAPQIRKLAVEGAWLTTQELSYFLGWLRGIRAARQFIEQKKELIPTLYALINQLPFSTQMIGQIEKVLDEHGMVRDSASPALAGIRKRLVSAGAELRGVLNRLLRKAQENNWTQDKEIALRNDRLVIPVKAESKNNVPGFVQDISQTGSTVYVEPAEALPLNNELRELQLREQNEIIRILQELTGKLRVHAGELSWLREALVELDIVRGKARMAMDLKAEMPALDPKSQVLNVSQAYYPLLLFKAMQEPFQVIPVEVKLSLKRRIMVISGPNAGGKSVTLKTVGLLQLMLQSGFLLPAGPDSVFPVFDSLFIDIGDEQSVDSDLSTYTSRLFSWRQMGDHMGKQSLFLIDEFGSGTDPKQGAAIAEAFLERFVYQQSFGIITTHYGNLKDYAEITEGVVNAAMQFDTTELKPTYRLIDGLPGRSYAFEMAQRVGVHPTILKKARRKMGTEEVETEQLLKELERKNTDLGRLVEENRRKEQKLNHLVEKYDALKLELERDRKKLIREAKVEAKMLIDNANRRIETVIREIKESQAEQNVTRQLRQELMAAAPDPGPQESSPEEIAAGGIEVLTGEKPVAGDWVRLRNTGAVGQLIDIQGNRSVVESGEMRLTVKTNQLEKIRQPRQNAPKAIVSYKGDIASLTAKMELDVLGKRPEEALPEVEKFVDQAISAGFHRVRVLHGKGTGALREAIRRHLTAVSSVIHMTDAPASEGGSGWTVIELKP
ncbi:MAG: endonuclease MutS2 [Bacteroidetes bacterium]|nr:MAG: endonuclease MutS2 [Bacteroidota bacterium]